MRDTDYAYAVARIRSNESRLLTAQDIDALIASGSAAKCMAQLSDRGWDGGAGQDEASMLAAELRKTWELIDEVAPDSSVFDSFRIKNDFHNLKAALKGRLAGCEWKHLCMTPATVDIAVIEKAVREKAFSLLPEAMRDSAAEAYNALVEWGDGQLCEMILDRASLESAIAEAKKTGGLVLELAELGAFESDVRIAARCAAMKKPLGTIVLSLARCDRINTERLAEAAVQGENAVCEHLSYIDKEASEALAAGLGAFGRLCDRRREQMFDRVKYSTFGVEPLVAYIASREREVRRVRIILAGLRNGIDAESIRSLF